MLERCAARGRGKRRAGVTRELLANHPELAALYAPSGGVEGIIQALRERPAALTSRWCATARCRAVKWRCSDGTVDLLLCHRISELAATIVETLLAPMNNRDYATSLIASCDHQRNL